VIAGDLIQPKHIVFKTIRAASLDKFLTNLKQWQAKVDWVD